MFYYLAIYGVCLCEWVSVYCVDVVRAYKGVLKEKEALEATVKALSVAQEKDADLALLTEEEGDCPSDNQGDNEVEKSDIGDDVGSDMSDSGAEGRGGEKKSTTSLRMHISPSGTTITQ